MVDYCTHKRREPESQEMQNSLAVPCYECVPLPQYAESTFNWVPLTVRIRVPLPRVLCFVPERIFKLLLLGRPRKDPHIPGDMHIADRRCARQNQKHSPLRTTLTVEAGFLFYPKQMGTRN